MHQHRSASRIARLAVGVLLPAALLTGCGDDSTSSTAAVTTTTTTASDSNQSASTTTQASTEAATPGLETKCQLLTTADVEAATGGTVTQGLVIPKGSVTPASAKNYCYFGVSGSSKVGELGTADPAAPQLVVRDDFNLDPAAKTADNPSGRRRFASVEEFTRVLGDVAKPGSGVTGGADLPAGVWDTGFVVNGATDVQVSFIKGTDSFDLVWHFAGGTTQTDDTRSRVSVALQGIATALCAHL